MRTPSPLLPALALVTVAGCAVNPATGKRQISFISESQEIAMGKEYDPAVTASVGLYPDENLQAYVSDLGTGLALVSERSNLPWSFKVVDDPAVNAFAVPGGFIYVTRGILAALNSEAELVGVMGHEVGHITARHTVSQMTRQQIQNLGLGIGMVLSKDVARYGQVIAQSLQVLNLSYSRGDESQADELGVRYMSRREYDPHALIGVFQTLALVSGEGSRLPEWQLTHPYPETREKDIRAMIDAQGETPTKIEQAKYLDRIHGIVYGEDPREGYFDGRTFHHPGLAFRLDFPREWKTINQKTAVGGISPSQDAMIVLTLAEKAASPLAAVERFLTEEGIQGGPAKSRQVNGLEAAGTSFRATTEEGEVQGEIGIVAHGENLFQILGYGMAGSWSGYRNDVLASIDSFGKETNTAVLTAEPARLEVVTLSRAMTFEEFLDKFPSSVPSDEIARINRAAPADRFEKGDRLKRVTGGKRP